MTSSLPPAIAEIVTSQHDTPRPIESIVAPIKNSMDNQTNELLSQSNQIKFLIGCILLLFGWNMWWIRNAFNTNQDHHRLFESAITGVKSDLDGLMGEHRMSMSFNGCAADPKIIQRAIEDALSPLQNLYTHQRQDDVVAPKGKKERGTDDQYRD